MWPYHLFTSIITTSNYFLVFNYLFLPTAPLSFYMLGRSDYDWLLGGVRWHLALCLLVTTLVIFLCLIKGAKSSGKVRI